MGVNGVNFWFCPRHQQGIEEDKILKMEEPSNGSFFCAVHVQRYGAISYTNICSLFLSPVRELLFAERLQSVF